MTVLYLDHTAAASGGEIALVRLLEALDLAVVRPVVLLAADGPIVERLAALNVATHVLPLRDAVRNVRKDTLGLGAIWKLGPLLWIFWYGLRVAWFARGCGADIIHANSLKSDIYGAIAGFLARRPVIWHVRDHINPSYLPAPAAAVFRFLARRMPTFVIANSRSTLDELQINRNCPSAVVPSGIELRSSVVHDGLVTQQPGSASLAETGSPGSNPPDTRPWHSPVRIGIVGRIARWKGQHIFLEAAARVAAAGHNAEFWIVGAPLFGEEAYERELRRQTAASGLGVVVKFLGFQENAQEIYRSLDIFVHASVSPEPFGQVVIEAMAEGLPVIATDAGGVREIVVHGKNGWLVPMADAPALAAAIEGLLADPPAARCVGAAGHAWVREHFTAARSARKIEQIYGSILRT